MEKTMSTFQLIITAVVFYLFFRQLFSEDHPKRGVDFEAKVADEQIGGINRPDKVFSTPTIEPTRMTQLLQMADDAVEKKDYEEAQKALGSALIIEKDNKDALQKMGFVCVQNEAYDEAKEHYEHLLSLEEENDLAHASLANTLHKLKEDDNAIKHHERAIELDTEYAPHYFNYANTLYDLERNEEALIKYKEAYALDNSLEEAQKMITKLSK